MSDPLRLVVFDVDGTLIDSREFIVEAMRRGFEISGLELPSEEQILSIVGLSLYEAVQQIRPDLPHERLTELAGLYKEAFIALRRERGGEGAAPMYSGARDALARLQQRDEILLGVATGKARRGLDHAIESHGLQNIFQTLQTADGHPSKPNPEMLFSALRETGVEACNSVMIGDTEFDIAMGRAAGFKTIAVDWGYHPLDRIEAAGPDIIISHFDALGEALEEVWSNQ